MDTTYVTIMLIVFLVLTGLAVDIGYLYVSEEDLQSAAETAALAGTQSIKQRILFQVQNDPKKIREAYGDPVQAEARSAAVAAVSGKHSSVSLVGLASNNGNALTDDNDLTVGFWNVSSQSYTPGGTPANAMQVRTRRTAESSSVGMGGLGSFLAKITGTENFGSTPVAIASIPARTRANIALCTAACDPACSYPEICAVKERKMSRAPWEPGQNPPPADRYRYTSLLHPVTLTNTMSDMICGEGTSQEVCGKPIYTSTAASDDSLRDIQAMMYNPRFDRSNKEYDKSGKLLGWWVIVPVTDCGSVTPGNAFEPHTVTRYSLVRISRICAGSPAGCQQSAGGPQDAPAAACGSGDWGLYLDRISCVGCGDKAMMLLPGLHPALVK
jgi:Flp pilus assembly protein TadG